MAVPNFFSRDIGTNLSEPHLGHLAGPLPGSRFSLASCMTPHSGQKAAPPGRSAEQSVHVLPIFFEGGAAEKGSPQCLQTVFSDSLLFPHDVHLLIFTSDIILTGGNPVPEWT
jgi:hypothetical protein